MGVIWKENAIVNVKLTYDLFTLVQMYQDPYLQFFKISNNTGKWGNVDLTDVSPYLFVATDRFFCRDRLVEKLKQVKPISIKPPQYAISTRFADGPCLVEPIFRDGIYDSFNAKIIKRGLDFVQDEELFRKYELINMELNWNLTTRLIYFFETGNDICLDKLSRFYPNEFKKYSAIFKKRFVNGYK